MSTDSEARKKRRVEWIPRLEEAGSSASKRGFSRATMTYIRVEVAPKAGPEFSSFSSIAGRHLKEVDSKEERPLQLSHFQTFFPAHPWHEISWADASTKTSPASFCGKMVERDEIGGAIRLELSREIYIYIYLFITLESRWIFSLMGRNTKTFYRCFFQFLRNASSYLIRKRFEKTLFPYDRVKDDHFLENEGTRKSSATCLSVLEDAIQGSRIAPPPLSVRLLIKGICL